jgi:hypothetical protein
MFVYAITVVLHCDDVSTRRFCADPLYVIVDVRLGVEGIPTTAYRTAEEVEVRTSNRYYILFGQTPC